METSESSFFKATWGSLKNALIGCSMAAVFGLVVLAMSILSANNPKAAEESMMPTPTPASMSGQVQYYLPYPGMLPDSSLYRVKALRDRISIAVSRSKEIKARKELLFADKRIGAAQALILGGKTSLGVSTATKAEKYLEQSVNDTLELLSSGKDVKSLMLSLSNATAKHMEVLDSLKAKVGEEDVASLEKARMTTLLLKEKIDQTLASSN